MLGRGLRPLLLRARVGGYAMQVTAAPDNASVSIKWPSAGTPTLLVTIWCMIAVIGNDRGRHEARQGKRRAAVERHRTGG